MDELGAVGMKVATNMGGIYLGDPLFDPLLEEWNRRGAIVIIHPCRARLRPQNVITGKVAAIYEYPADTTRAVLNMIASRTMTRFPDIRWIVPHCGSFLPYMLQRFTGVSGILASMGMMETVDVQAEFEKLYFDIAGDPEPVHLDMLRMVAADDRIVFGSDFPHSPARVILAKKQHFDSNEKYTGIREQIYSRNALKLLNGE
jgi:predicted TIM-barrel fold metal-dependent hydrolase